MTTTQTVKTSAAPKLKVCKARIFNGVERVVCNTPYVTLDCPKEAEHVGKFKSGFCNNGFCEGTKPKSSTGKGLKTCSLYTWCACKCHEQLDKMFKDIGEERILIENPEYVPERIDFNIEDYINLPGRSGALAPVPVIGPDGVEIPAAASLATNPALLAERRTETGRAARGGLEAQVHDLLTTFMSKGAQGLITPRILADAIAEHYKIPTPSTGAIGAVWDRWSKLGFAKQEKQPVRFLDFEGQGTWDELQILKAKAKRAKKIAEANKFKR